jgi:hypothetical protein
MSSADDQIMKLRAVMNNPAATAGERAAARERIAAIKNPGRGMSDAELAATIARLKDERAAIPIPHDVERRRKEKWEEIERYEQERNKRYKKKLKAMTDEEVAAAARLKKHSRPICDRRPLRRPLHRRRSAKAKHPLGMAKAKHPRRW